MREALGDAFFPCSYFIDTSGFQGFCSLIYLSCWVTGENLRVCVKAWHESWAMNKSAVSKSFIYSFRSRSSLTLLRLVPRRRWQHIGLLSQCMQITRQMLQDSMNTCISSDRIKCFLFALVFHFQALSFPPAVHTVISHSCKTWSPRWWLNLGRFSVCQVIHAWRYILVSVHPYYHFFPSFFIECDSYSHRRLENSVILRKMKEKKQNYSLPKKNNNLIMGNNWPVEWALDRQCTYSL